MDKKLQQILEDVAKNKNEVIEKLLTFLKKDILLCWSNNDKKSKRREVIWAPILRLVGGEITSIDIEKPSDNEFRVKFKIYLEGFSDKELAAFCYVAIMTNSVILATAFVKRKINAKETFVALSLANDSWQEENNPEQQKILEQLIMIEEILNK